jgi:sensory transduction histidine kinase
MSRRILKPINNVIKTAKSISTDDLSKRIEIPKEEDELQNLTLIINEMLDRLETSFENQTKFVSDASHELRTPLAIIKGYAEIIRKRGMSDIDIFVESIDSIISETDNMRNLIQKLLFLAKGEITKINTKFVDIDANEMIHQIHSDTVVSNKTHNFHLEMGENYKIKGDETLLQQAIRALIENATKYSEPHTNIYIKSVIKDGFGRISIRDEGVGISDEDAKRIFDRFYRVDLSRTKATGGTGLGLAIVKRIVEIHNGKIEIESKMNEGTEISIVLPIGENIVKAAEENDKNVKKERTEKKRAVFSFLKKEKEHKHKKRKNRKGK